MKEFKAIIKQHSNKNAAYVEPPFDVYETFGSKRVKVKATFDGVEYRGSITSMDGIYMLGLTQEIRNKIQKGFGDEILVTVEKDVEERTVEVPEDLKEVLSKNEAALTTFQSLSYSAQKEYVTWITSAKQEETRSKRLLKALDLLAKGEKLK